ncbi:gliding motility-associated C-terminal domain-containing protein [Mangrovimonas spongiae]|uniref:Gliding motility-associated C-terminal domain-containing protein n=1 Tax=Mangrovimonas spongiae TaxID=2494697 RepID=A0A3R9UV20_9FLAO|nr:gliding motility-associated C-terminal domain-containing protein [Mangrovimonas spongiae]
MASYAQQISVDDTYTPQQLIENNLILGCVEVSNIQSTINGQVNQISSYGYFEQSTSNFPFQNGILLSTGAAFSAGNTTNANVLNEGDTNWGTDSDLETALGISNTLNATAIEFDFISVANQVQFNYILASEEYFADYPCQYSDGFAFLIKEAGTNNPYTNIAVIPGTNTPVNTSTIHEEIVGLCPAENEQYFDGYNVGDTNFNGRTTVLTASASIQPNVQYHIKLVIADQSDENYDSAVFIEGNSFNATVDLGPDIVTCADNTTLNADINNPLASYTWLLNGQPIANENAPQLTTTASGSYTVQISIPINNTTCDIEDSIEVTLGTEQPAIPISDFAVCDTDGDAVETFDLSTKDNEALSIVPPGNYTISYHNSLTNAQNNDNPITAPIQNQTNPQTIYIRILDADNGCVTYSSFNLIVNELPDIVDPAPVEICDDSVSDGVTQIDLTQYNNDITNGNTALYVSYHYSQQDANTGDNPIPMPYVNTNPQEQIFIRVIDGNTGCETTSSLNITVLETPDINANPESISACEQDEDGFEFFDLSPAIDDILQGATNTTITFHTSLDDANTGNNPIQNIENFQNTTPYEQVIYVRVVNNDTGCPSITSFNIYTNILEQESDIRDFLVCDDSSNDGIANFNLENIGNSILNNLENATITFYENETNQENGTNPIDQTVPYQVSNSAQLFVTISNTECDYNTSINLIVNPAVFIQSLEPQDYCDTDDDGFTSIDLNVFDDYVSTGIPNPSVTYFLNQTDAENNVNFLPPFYTNTSNPQTFYARVTDATTGCYDISPLEINILPAPTVSQAQDILICDNDQDGVSTVNLDNKIPEIITNTNGVSIDFFTTEDNANNNINAINTPDNFSTNTTPIFTRVTNNTTGCFAISTFMVYINTQPVFTDIADFTNCETDGNQTAEFLFIEKDAEILNGQTGKQVLYFLNQNDAINRQNIIDKNQPYQNISSPQTIHVRVENITDQDCYGVSSFIIEVGAIPIFNAPTDLSLCDDITNDGQEEFNLAEVINTISENSPENLSITFHTSYDDADNGTNTIDLNYTNTENPQQIFARVENGTYCHGIAEFGLNVIQVPLVNAPSEMTVCDTNYDGIATFDLTIAETEVLGIRQDNVELTYHESIADVENNIEIPTPASYNNIENPQTVYIKATNTISNCYVYVPLVLNVNLPPSINAVNFEICDNSTNSYNLNDTLSQLLDTQENIDVNFYATQQDAQNNTNAISTDYTYTSNNTTLYITATNSNTGCRATQSFNLTVNPTPIANQPQNLISCDDNFDGFYTFDFSQQTNTILGNQNPNQFNVSYFETENDALENTNPITNLNYSASNGQTIYVRVENVITNCFSTTSFSTIVHRKPEVNIGNQTICIDNLPLIVSAETGFNTDTYLWSTNQTASEIEITQIGSYSVTVTTENGCETTSTFSVIESEQATIEFTETIDFSDPNNITVTVSGIGNYQYSIDNGPPQDSNVFYNVTWGPHIIEVKDLNGCASAIKEIVVIDAPLFFTPNNDGYNDYWHIAGVEQLEGTVIYIFDRFGKLLKTLSHSSQGWDGTYRGENMPTNDYWFLAEVKKGDISFEVKRHFTLKR